jgi:hypothetical protein
MWHAEEYGLVEAVPCGEEAVAIGHAAAAEMPIERKAAIRKEDL